MEIEALNDFFRREFQQVAHEIRVEALTETGVRVRLSAGERHLWPGGTVSGPAIFLLADVAAYCAIMYRVGPSALAARTNAVIDFPKRLP